MGIGENRWFRLGCCGPKSPFLVTGWSHSIFGKIIFQPLFNPQWALQRIWHVTKNRNEPHVACFSIISKKKNHFDPFLTAQFPLIYYMHNMPFPRTIGPSILVCKIHAFLFAIIYHHKGPGGTAFMEAQACRRSINGSNLVGFNFICHSVIHQNLGENGTTKAVF